MNIEIANRLVTLRKNNNLSQEALAEKLGISRQAVSKWERAEASPDTDNLIMLARLYGVSLDELLKTEEEIPTPEIREADGEDVPSGSGTEEEKRKDRQSGSETEEAEAEEKPEYVHVGLGGVHVKDKDGSEVHVGWDGIHVDDRKREENVHIDKNGVFVNGRKYDKSWFAWHQHFPVTVIICVIYLLIGVFFGAWHPGWLLFLLVPIWYSLIEAVARRNADCFAYPVLVTLLFLCGGFFLNAWHPGWVLFITIPVYYSVVSWFKYVSREREKEWENSADTEDYNR